MCPVPGTRQPVLASPWQGGPSCRLSVAPLCTWILPSVADSRSAQRQRLTRSSFAFGDVRCWPWDPSGDVAGGGCVPSTVGAQLPGRASLGGVCVSACPSPEAPTDFPERGPSLEALLRKRVSPRPCTSDGVCGHARASAQPSLGPFHPCAESRLLAAAAFRMRQARAQQRAVWPRGRGWGEWHHPGSRGLGLTHLVPEGPAVWLML